MSQSRRETFLWVLCQQFYRCESAVSFSCQFYAEAKAISGLCASGNETFPLDSSRVRVSVPMARWQSWALVKPKPSVAFVKPLPSKYWYPSVEHLISHLHIGYAIKAIYFILYHNKQFSISLSSHHRHHYLQDLKGVFFKLFVYLTSD